MIRRDGDYWQRLRKDRRSNAAVLLTALAALISAVSMTMVVVPGTHYAARGNPLYWLILVPVAWWVNSLAAFEPGAVRSWNAVLALVCVSGGACLVLAILAGQDVPLNVIAFAATLAAATGSVIVRRGSMVAREGPAR